jgi:TolB-like protein
VQQAPAVAERRTEPATAPAPAPRVTATSDEGRRTIAVLPFVNMSGDVENEYFSDGLSEEILNLLAKLPQLHGRERVLAGQRVGGTTLEKH